MRLKQVLIANRMNVSFLLLLILMISCAPLIFFNETVWVIIPFVIALLLIAWIIYSSIEKNNLVEAKVFSDNHSDFVGDLEKVFKPNSQLKRVFAAYGMSIALMIVFCTLCIAISPEILTRNASPLRIVLAFVLAFAISYIFIRKRLK
jgi:hypothetical protein